MNIHSQAPARPTVGIYYSDFQHKGNIGEGQFHINRQTLQIHLDYYHHKTLSYEELYELLTGS